VPNVRNEAIQPKKLERRKVAVGNKDLATDWHSLVRNKHIRVASQLAVATRRATIRNAMVHQVSDRAKRACGAGFLD